jgi:hypothetical protein
MADFTPTIYAATRAVSTAPNFTDNETAATSGNNYYYPNDGRVVLIVNAAASSNVTVATPNTVDGLAVTDLVLALADTDVRVVGPFPPNIYNDSQGRILVTVSADTSIMAIRV